MAKNNSEEYVHAPLLKKEKALFHFFGTKHTNIEVLLKTLADGCIRVVMPVQTHGCQIAKVTAQNLSQAFESTDALITNETGICIAVKTADCVPVLLFDPVQKAIAAIHSGWRSTVQNIVGKTVEQLVAQYQSRPENLLAAIGPCIGQKHYEVGRDVLAYFEKEPLWNYKAIDYTGCNDGKGRLNLSKTIAIQLQMAGLKSENIEELNLCTFNNTPGFYSARRDGSATGRMINGIMLK